MNYQVGGTLMPDAQTYVERPADRQLYDALTRGEFCYVLSCRQMGKSSLLMRIKQRLLQAGYRCAAIDMTNIGNETITPAQWYKGVAAELWSSLQRSPVVDLKQWWDAQGDCSPVQKLSRFIEAIVLTQVELPPVVVLIDEIDSVLSLNFAVDEFFALIQACHSPRFLNANERRITFAVFGVASPESLMPDAARSPFPQGTDIELQGFGPTEIQQVANPLATAEASQWLEEILAWTNGQPFLVQKLCQFLKQSEQTVASLPLLAPDAQSPGSSSPQERIAELVQTRIVHNWIVQDKPEHLRTICDRLLRHPQASRMLVIYRQLLQEATVHWNSSSEQTELRLTGLVIRQQGILKIANPIYRAVFTLDWVEQQLAALESE